jgi:hypothetical protein
MKSFKVQLLLAAGCIPWTLGAAISIERFTVSGGGGGSVQGGFSVTGSAGQAAVGGPISGDRFTVTGGFWAFGNSSAPPVSTALIVGPDTVSRLNTSVVAKVTLGTLLGNDIDPLGNVLSILDVGNAQPSGATVQIVGPFVVYVAPDPSAGNGSFTYTLSNGDGGHTAIGTVTVLETAPGEPANAPNFASIHRDGADFTITFIGVPGYAYRVQYTTSAVGPYVWNEFPSPAVYVAPSTDPVGVFSHVDLAPTDPIRLYRAIPQ